MICPSWPYKYKAFEGLYTQNKAKHGVVRTVMQTRAFSIHRYSYVQRQKKEKKKFFPLLTNFILLDYQKR